jgi:UDP-N-acetylmuramoyl-tripeptide--D-alanyl-D-alanine ligase
MAAVKIGLYFDVEISLIKAALEAYKPSALRSEIITWNGHEVLLDCYNANPSSMEVFIDSVSKSPFTNKILILGEMLELGIYTEEEHQNLVNNFIPYENFDFVLFLGSAFRDIKLKYSNSFYFENTDELRAALLEKLSDTKYHIFVKGSRSNKLEKVFDR